MISAKVSFVLPASLLPETFFPPNIYNFCLTVIPEASIDALKEQLAAAQRTIFFFPLLLCLLFIFISVTLLTLSFPVTGEKDQLIRQHQEELNAHKTSYQELKSQLIQLGLDHAKALKAAEVNAAAKLDEALEDACNATVVLRAELEEMAKARKGAEEKAARLEEEHKECNQLILQTDTLAYREFFSFTYFDYCIRAFFPPTPFSFRYLPFRSLFLPDFLSGLFFFRILFLNLFLSSHRPLSGLAEVRCQEGRRAPQGPRPSGSYRAMDAQRPSGRA
jgi:hypothetical protein